MVQLQLRVLQLAEIRSFPFQFLRGSIIPFRWVIADTDNFISIPSWFNYSIASKRYTLPRLDISIPMVQLSLSYILPIGRASRYFNSIMVRLIVGSVNQNF
jgi:hypothetical protein